MAMESIDNATVIEFSAQVHVAAQQAKARLRPYTMIRPMSGKSFAYDGIGQVEATEVIGRHQPQSFSDINHNRRKIARRRFVLTLPIDAADVRSVLLNPEGEYAAACARAMERVYDRIVAAAMFADVLTGEDFATTVSYANDGGATVTATAGLTYAKLLEIGKFFIDNEVGTDVPEKLLFGISGDEHSALMSEIELVSGDYSANYSVDKGRMTNAAGLDLVLFGGGVSKPVLDVTSGVRTCFAMSSRAMCVGLSKDMTLKVEDRPDLVETKQVTIVFDFGAVRTEGKQIAKVTTTDA